MLWTACAEAAARRVACGWPLNGLDCLDCQQLQSCYGTALQSVKPQAAMHAMLSDHDLNKTLCVLHSFFRGGAMLSHAFGVPHRLLVRLYGTWSVPFNHNFACRSTH